MFKIYIYWVLIIYKDKNFMVTVIPTPGFNYNYETRTIESELCGVLILSGEVDANTTQDFPKEISKSFSKESKFLIVDLTNVTFLDSAGLSVLLFLSKHTEASKGKFCIICPKGNVILRVITLSGFDKIMPIYEKLEDVKIKD